MKTLTFVIFGGTGDLAKKKLGKSLSEYAKKNMNLRIQVIGIGRHSITNSNYKKILETAEQKFKFPKNVEVKYYQGDATKPETFKDLEKTIILGEKDIIGRIFYLATSYEFFGQITDIVAKFKSKGFTRIMVEKPFGYNYKSSESINKKLKKHFSEEQIFRVDHYMAKATVDNILLMRFSNPLFENTWNSKFIDKIKIKISENFGVGNRLSYYNNSGAIRDMIQNHMFQTLLFILMEPPKYISSEEICKQKYLASKKVDFSGKLILGQYENYQKELDKTTLPQKGTETFAQVHLKSNQPRWKGTDIILMTGKNLDKKEAHITLEYKKEPCTLYCSLDTVPNKLIFRIQPREDVELTMNMTEPGNNPTMKKVRMTFCKECEFEANTTESYETIISECVKGDKRMFIDENILKESWRVTDKILKAKMHTSLKTYKKGSLGPV